MFFIARTLPFRKSDQEVCFRVVITGIDENKKFHEFKIRVGAGDNGEGVLTLMCIDE
jgi:hypothetical protein